MAPSNFQFLEDEYPLLFNLAQAAEYNLYQDPATSLFKLRQYGEYMAKQIFETYGMGLPEDSKFQNLVYILRNQGILPSNVIDHFTILRKQGNDAVHEYIGTTADATSSLFSAFKLGKWFYESYSVKNREISALRFKKPENLDTRHALHILEEENKVLKDRYERTVAQQKTVTSEERLAYTTRAKRSASKLDMDEAQTRELIDANLRKMGWEADTVLLNAKAQKTQPRTPFTRAAFADFVKAYTGGISIDDVKESWQGDIEESKRAEMVKEDNRWQVFSREAIAAKGDSLDIGLIADSSLSNAEDLGDPIDIAKEAMSEQQAINKELEDLIKELS